MATVVLNVAVELSSRYELSKLENSLISSIKTKWDLSMKYTREMNNDGGWFVDAISCPQNIIMSWSTLRTTWIDTEIRFLTWSVLCLWESVHGGGNLALYFNSQYDDFFFAEFNWSQVAINQSSLTGTFSDPDNTQIDIWSTAYFSPDGIDDNFDSDNYSPYSTWSITYPDWYNDRDDESKRINFWYILEWSGLFNILWSNSQMSNYIKNTPSNTNSDALLIWDITDWHLYLDIDSSFRLVVYRINKAIYDNSMELVIESSQFWTWQIADIWYIQNDLTLSDTINSNTMSFDFTANDYAVFVENTGSGSLLYKLTAESSSWESIYINPIDDSDPSIFWYLWSHMLVDNEGRLIADQFEILGLKSANPFLPSGINMWLDASDTSTISVSSWLVSEWRDKSWNWNILTQSTLGDRPSTWISKLGGLNTISFSQDYLRSWSQVDVVTSFFVVQNPNWSSSGNNVTPIYGKNTGSSAGYTFINTPTTNWYDISIDGNTWGTWTAYFGWATSTGAGTNINLWLSLAEVDSPAIWSVVHDAPVQTGFFWWLTNGTLFKGNLDIWEIITYDRVLTPVEMNRVWNYLSQKWNLPWLDL